MPWRSLPPVVTPATIIGIGKATFSSGFARESSRALERTLVSMFDAQQVVLVNSGTSALRLAIRFCNESGGRIALPAFGCFDLATAAIGEQVGVHLYDVNPTTLAPDLDSLRSVLIDGARCVVVASVFGYTAAMPELATLCREFGASIVEDIAQGLGATHADRLLGSWGDAVVMSFGRGKGVGGAGGGAVAFRNSAHDLESPSHQSARVGVRGLGSLLAQHVLSHPLLFGIPSSMPGLRLGETQYHAPSLIRAIDGAQSDIADAALKRLAKAIADRAQRARKVEAAIISASGLSADVCPIVYPQDSHPAFLRVGLRCHSRRLAHLRSLGARPSYPIPLSQLQPLASVRVPNNGVLGAQCLAEQLVSLPTHRFVTDSDIARIQSGLGVAT